ncbi:hypothetical protein ACFQBS_34675 [Planomonospora parontospora]|uniref:hypothetical protein n=1 Tax=Planomonospora parontospora TaxID=58119 RepID=UPI003605C356
MEMSPHARRDANKRGWYFSPTDGGIEHSVNSKSFRDSLIFHLLFEPAPLVITDVFFFNCRYLIEHLEGSEYPIFLRALKSGLITPAFRSSSTETFSQSLNEIGGQGILGIEQNQYKFSPQSLAERLDSAFDASLGDGPIIWPENMGSAFAELAHHVFIEQEELLVEDQNLAAIWQRIEPFRTECLEEARRTTSILGGDGIRRAEIFDAVGRKLGILSAGELGKPRDLLRAVKSTDGIRPFPLHGDIELFVDAVNLCYQQSQASKFGCGHNIPGALAHHAIPLLPRSSSVAMEENAITFQTRVNLPSFATLERADSGELIAIRESDPAQQYFDMRSAWAKDPSSDREAMLKKSIHEYAKALRKVAKGPQRSTMIGAIRLVARPGAESVGAIIGAALGAAVGTSAAPGLFGAAVGAAVGGSGTFLVKAFQELRPGPRASTRKQDIRIESVFETPDLNIPFS